MPKNPKEILQLLLDEHTKKISELETGELIKTASDINERINDYTVEIRKLSTALEDPIGQQKTHQAHIDDCLRGIELAKANLERFIADQQNLIDRNTRGIANIQPQVDAIQDKINKVIICQDKLKVKYDAILVEKLHQTPKWTVSTPVPTADPPKEDPIDPNLLGV